MLLNIEIINKIKNIVKNSNYSKFPPQLSRHITTYFTNNEIKIIKSIDEKEFKIYCYLLKNNINNPKCKFCDEYAFFWDYSTGFHDICKSQKCKSSKRKETCLEKYGVDSVMKVEETKSNHKKTCLEKYGVENPLQSKIVQEKGKATNLERYGVEYHLSSPRTRANILKTCLEKYGVENPMQSKIVQEKGKATNLERYGVENVYQSEKIKEIIKETNLQKYGFEHYSQTGLNENSGYKWKEYLTPNNNVLRIQGYEDKLLDELLIEYSEDEIITERKNIPEIWYIGNDNKKHRYFPDAYVSKTNTIYEVKSEYTLNVNLEINKLKFQAVKDSGYNFILKVY